MDDCMKRQPALLCRGHGEEVLLSDVVGGFGSFVWIIEGYDGAEIILQPQRIPLNDATEAKISGLLHGFASKHLTLAEISAGLADVRRDEHYGNRISLTAGKNPYYVASLWRSDELDAIVE
jgi:hypothetical protein